MVELLTSSISLSCIALFMIIKAITDRCPLVLINKYSPTFLFCFLQGRAVYIMFPLFLFLGSVIKIFHVPSGDSYWISLFLIQYPFSRLSHSTRSLTLCSFYVWHPKLQPSSAQFKIIKIYHVIYDKKLNHWNKVIFPQWKIGYAVHIMFRVLCSTFVTIKCYFSIIFCWLVCWQINNLDKFINIF